MRTSIVDNSPETQPANQSARSADPTADCRHPNLGRSQFVERVSRSPRRPTLRLRALGSRTRALEFGVGRASEVTVIQNPHPITVVPCLLTRRRRSSLSPLRPSALICLLPTIRRSLLACLRYFQRRTLHQLWYSGEI